mmetsp:Transcript_56820/g.132879  ORF Transcript_56820/g.132879 Transcript_56820/m.132879 type:complete len:130 (+) Transcript_56820:30-419(+)
MLKLVRSLLGRGAKPATSAELELQAQLLGYQGRNFAAWWKGGPRKPGEKRPKFLRVGESLYKVKDYRLAYRRFFGRDIQLQEQYDFAQRQHHAVQVSKERYKSKAASNPQHASRKPTPDVVIYPYEKWK